MKSRLLLDVVVGEGAAVLQLLSGEDQSLLVRWDSFLVLDLALNVVDGVGRLNLEGDGLASNCRRKYVSILLCGDVVVDCRGQVA